MTEIPKKFLSIILASIRPHDLSQFLFSLQETADDPASFEVLVKIDEGDDAMRDCLEMAQEMYSFDVRFIQTPKDDGYYTLHRGYQALYEISDPQTYFVVVVNDELRFVTKGWDTVLKKYIGLFPDHAFRLKISQQKLRNYYSPYECGPCPENYPITTRRWMELTEGIGDCWGPDVWHQMIDYHLGAASGPNAALFRGIPVYEIKIRGEEAGRQISAETIKKRTLRIHQEWWQMVSVERQQKIRRLAVKVQAYIWAMQRLGAFSIRDNSGGGIYEVYSEEDEQPAGFFPYYLSANHVRIHRFALLLRCIRGSLGDMRATLYAYAVPGNESTGLVLKYMMRVVRCMVIGIAFLAAPIVPHFGFRPRKNWLEFCSWLNNCAYVMHYGIMKKCKGEDWVLTNFQTFQASYRRRHQALFVRSHAICPVVYCSPDGLASAEKKVA